MRVRQSAHLYREAVRNLNTTLTEPVERQEARALIAELLGVTRRFDTKVRRSTRASDWMAAYCSRQLETN